MRFFYLLAASLVCLGFVSCAPVGGYPESNGGGGASAQGGGGVSSPGQGGGALSSSSVRPTAGQLGDIQRAREAQVTSRGIGREAHEAAAIAAGELTTTDDVSALPALPSLGGGTNYRYAIPVPGRNGWVYNPYTNTTVDARGVESHRLIYDETDPANRNEDGTLKPVEEMPHKFYMP